MKIRETYTSALTGVSRVRRRRGVTGAETVNGVGESDQVSLSSRGLEIQRARLLAIQAPEIREDLVEALDRQIREGRYRAPALEVLDRIIRDPLHAVAL